MSYHDLLKSFVFDCMLAESNIAGLEAEGISVRSERTIPLSARIEETDFSPRVRFSAQQMASVYTLFYCLENAVRELISQRLLERKGVDWWNHVPKKIRDNSDKVKVREAKNRHLSTRSLEPIGYTMFGDLAQIIIANWNEFSDLFPDQHWVQARFNDLELVRNMIMHTGLLPQIEIDRVESIVRDWLRQVG